MANRYVIVYSLLALAVLQGCAARINLDNEEYKDTRERIHGLIGGKQLGLRTFLAETRIDRQQIEHDIREIARSTKDQMEDKVREITDGIKKHGNDAIQSGATSEQQQCLDAMSEKVKTLSKQAENAHKDCVSKSKPDLLKLAVDVSTHAEFQTKIGITPRDCVATNSDADSVVSCVEKTLNDLAENMDTSKTAIRAHIKDLKNQVSDMRSAVEQCNDEEIKEMENKAKGITDKFDNCIKQ